MKTAYNSNSYDDFLKGKDEYQTQRKMSDVSMKDDLGAPREMPTEDFKENPSWAKKTIAKMKYSPTTASFSEFTRAKKEMQAQAAVGHNRDESTKLKMEDMGTEKRSKYMTGDKSFDVDVTEYKPRTAKSSTLKAPTK